MAVLTLEGIFKNGRVELSEIPAEVGDSVPVLVTFLPAKREDLPSHAPESAGAEQREQLRRAAFARMKRGIPLGGPPYPTREDLYDRFNR
jgi:hypothetical protein